MHAEKRIALCVLVLAEEGELAAECSALETAGFRVERRSSANLDASVDPDVVLIAATQSMELGDLASAFGDVPIASLTPPTTAARAAGHVFEEIPTTRPEFLPTHLRSICHRWARVAALKEEVRTLKNLEQAADLAYFEIDASSRCIRCSHSFLGLVGGELWSEQPTLDDLLMAVHPDDLKGLEEAVLRSLGHSIPFHAGFRILSPSGDEIHLEARGIPSSHQGGSNRLFCVIQNVTRLQERVHQAEWRSLLDPLTGLGNSSYLSKRGEELLEVASLEGVPVTVLYLDLDGFKNLNDTLGHSLGDVALMAVSARLLATLRASDVVCRDLETDTNDALVSRLGGDEFTIVLFATDDEGHARTVAERIQEALALPFQLDGREVHLGASIGIASFPKDACTMEALLTKADTALYDAKRSGGRCVRVYSSILESRGRRRQAIASRLREALREGSLELAYQPRIDVARQDIVGAEALLRWRDAELGRIAPLELITIAEDAGLMEEVGRWVQRTACRFAGDVRRNVRSDFLISVNASPSEIASEDFSAHLMEVLRGEGLDPSCFELEITEAGLLDDLDTVHRNLQDLSAIGVRIALDDFGSGISGLRNLTSLPLTTMKLDPSLTNGLEGGCVSSALTVGLLQIALKIGLRPVAEGVRTQEQLDFLLGNGCVEMQGARFSPPLPSSELERLLRFARFSWARPARASGLEVP